MKSNLVNACGACAGIFLVLFILGLANHRTPSGTASFALEETLWEELRTNQLGYASDYVVEESRMSLRNEALGEMRTYTDSIIRIHPRLPFFTFRVKRLNPYPKGAWGPKDREFQIEVTRGNDPAVRQTLSAVIAEPQNLTMPEVVGEDIDFDGYRDIRIADGIVTGGTSYFYWRFDPVSENFMPLAALNDLKWGNFDPLVDPRRKQIHTFCHGAWAGDFSHYVYRWTGGNLEKIGEEEEEWRKPSKLSDWLYQTLKFDFFGESRSIHQVSELRNGKMVLIEKTSTTISAPPP